jgi:hypothetical protein
LGWTGLRACSRCARRSTLEAGDTFSSFKKPCSPFAPACSSGFALFPTRHDVGI